MKSILIALFFLLSACSTQPLVVYSSTWKQEHDELVTKECRRCNESGTSYFYVVFEI